MLIRSSRQNQFMKFVSIIAGIFFSIIGLINLFWGNDPFYGLFVILLALIYFPHLADRFQKITGLNVPGWLKVLLGLFIIWSSVGVGELNEKIGMMLNTFN